MLRVNQIKVKLKHTEKDILHKTAEILRVKDSDILSFRIARQSVDARKKPDIFYTYSVDVVLENENKVLKAFKNKENMVSVSPYVKYLFPKSGDAELLHPVVIVGMGPAGLFAAYELSLHGYPVTLLERGKCIEERQRDVDTFWNTGVLDTESNVQFGEGGAGTFSDGKLNTLVKDKDGRNGEVLDTLVAFGAKDSIVYEAKPHIGTDVLSKVVTNMREKIKQMGGTVRFECKVTDICLKDGCVSGVVVNDLETIPCEALVLAIGHSARDTFEMLYQKEIPMEAKSFAVGLRVEHKQSMIDMSQYGTVDTALLGAAPYKVTAQSSVGRGVYSFCMCPGGYVVNASSEDGRTAVNGMSYSDRSGENANSAIIVSVSPDDFGGEHPLAGIYFQRELERKAYSLGMGKIPVQRFGDFESVVSGDGTISTDPENMSGLKPQNKGGYVWADVSKILPEDCNKAFVEGMHSFGRHIHGFDNADVILSGVESRTSSPVRMPRDNNLESVIKGLYPCGEGAGYAGGITSAAMDGVRVAEMIALKYKPSKR